MSDERIDALAESARNRGLKLVRSRVRTPGKRRFGKVGLTDASGKAVFGMDAKGPIGSPDDAEHFLRNLGAKDWGASLDVAVMPRKKPKKPAREAANDREPVEKPAAPLAKAKPKPAPRPPRPKEPPKPQLRDARPADAPRLAELIDELGHPIDEKQVRKNLAALKKLGETPLVATLDKQVVGLIGMHRTVTIHRDAPLGRITILVVTKAAQGTNLGRLLVEAAEDWCRKKGCKLVEVTSNDRRAAAHAFYRHMGYERSSIRFFRKL
ncbi:MAG TPA: GNAT family N-acetyltransferase [Sphingomicrobium sp.]|nr:GNAT family N-acetyltransferase [Sphingomicrobium sp.]